LNTKLLATKNEYETVQCHLYNSVNHTKPLFELQSFDFAFNISICRQCGLVFLSPRWLKHRYSEFYDSEYDKHFRPHELSNFQHEYQIKQSEQIYNRINSYVNKETNSVLDIGCGLGWTLKFLYQKLNIKDMTGIEQSQYCINHLKNDGSIRILTKDVDDSWHLDNHKKYDLIVMRHVLEHFLDPISILKKVTYSLKPNGIVYIAVPDMMNPRKQLLTYWFRLVHAYYFSTSTLERTTALAGLKPLTIQSSNSELWGIFEPGEHLPASSSVYFKQLAIIHYYLTKGKLRSIINRVRVFVPTQLKRMLPKGVRKVIRNLFK